MVLIIILLCASASVVYNIGFTMFKMPSLLCRSPLPHGPDQGPDSCGASGGTVGQAGTTPGPV